MYNTVVTVGQVLGMVRVHVSTSETDDAGNSQILFTASGWSEGMLPGQQEDDLVAYLEQLMSVLSRVLAIPRDAVD